MTWERPFVALRRGHSEGVTLRPIPNLKTLLGFSRLLKKKERNMCFKLDFQACTILVPNGAKAKPIILKC